MTATTQATERVVLHCSRQAMKRCWLTKTFSARECGYGGLHGMGQGVG
jgi:hypothetical protein